jgi:DNA (cytosine-5)-methyltransferase 1
MVSSIPIIDLFAGPGGLGEGFSSLTDSDGNSVFQTLMSIEMEQNAHRTLRLRSFMRKTLARNGQLPEAYLKYIHSPTKRRLAQLISQFPEEWSAASFEAVNDILINGDDRLVRQAKSRLQTFGGDFVLIGGPPCQAYSLAGRARRTHDKKGLENDVKQTLYKCYLQFIDLLHPAVFIMENVKGILSATHNSQHIFSLIEEDMERSGYTLYSLVTDSPTSTSDFIVKSEEYGVPQARHRVILLGVRNDIPAVPHILQPRTPVSFEQALEGIPKIRSGFSARYRNTSLNNETWDAYVRKSAIELLSYPECRDIQTELRSVVHSYLPKKRSAYSIQIKSQNVYDDWYRGRFGDNRTLIEHSARSHMPSDIKRYLFCSAFAANTGRSARLYDFPPSLLPEHKNLLARNPDDPIVFSDRFNTQIAGKPSTTITSHIAKDGHYFIHPDPTQCRSLTVREAARLQTFPDDYFFEGNRTSQYQQVGNAVPPLLAQQISQVVAEILGKPGIGFFDNE